MPKRYFIFIYLLLALFIYISNSSISQTFKYSCKTVNDCIVECSNIPSHLVYSLKNISSIWFPVLQSDGTCYLHNSLTNENL